MTRKDYVKFADLFRTKVSYDLYTVDTVRAIATVLADILEAYNPRFKRSQFYSA